MFAPGLMVLTETPQKRIKLPPETEMFPEHFLKLELTYWYL